MKPHLTAALALCLSACAGPEGYERGVSPTTARPPSTTYTPAGAGAPMAGQPGDKGRTRRGEEGREVPQQDGGGVWASGGRKGQVAVTPGRAERPVTRTPDGIPEEAWHRCWAEVQQCMNEVATASMLSDDDYECSRWRQLSQCGGVAVVEKGARGKEWNLKRFGDYTNAQTERVCKDANQGHRLNAVNAKISDLCQPRWRKAFRE